MSLTREHTILAKIEVTEGTDPTPTGVANAIACSNVTTTPLAGSTVDRQQVYPDLSATGKMHVNSFIQSQFDVELAGSGAAGDAPKWGVLSRACGLSETFVADTSVAYQPVSAGFEAAAFYDNNGGDFYKLLGSRATKSIIFAKDAIPLLRYTVTGRWNAVSAAALPTVDLSAFIDPLPMGNVNTPTMMIDGYPVVLESLQIDLGNTVVHRDRPNAEYVAITGRTVAGSISFEAPALGSKNFFTMAKSNAMVALQLVHGTEDGNIIQIDLPKFQLLQPTYADSDGVRLISANFQANRDSGDDEFVLTVM